MQYRHNRPKVLGFWQEFFPDTQGLVRYEGLKPPKRSYPGDYFLLREYMKACPIFAYLGENGCALYTDGEWEWTEFAVHHKYQKSFDLPEEFKAKIRSLGYEPKKVTDEQLVAVVKSAFGEF